MSGSAQDMLRVARSQLGYREGANNNTKYGKWYGANHQPWCDMFVSWCASQADAKGVGKFAFTPFHVNDFKKRKRWGHRPRVAAIVFYNFAGGNFVDHVGIVESIHKDGSITTIEGNYSDRVARVHRRSQIAGYGYPDYVKKAPGSGRPSPHSGAEAPQWPGRYLKQTKPMMHGNDVRSWQARMSKRGWHIEVDASYGPNSAKICRQFQADKNLEVDGVVGPKTWHATWEAPIT